MNARLIGIIGKACGLKGEVAIELLTDYPSTIKGGAALFFDESCREKAEIESVRSIRSKDNKNFLVAKLRGINDRNLAEGLKGRHVFRSVESAPELKRNQYWIDDIIGCAVYTAEGSFIGIVSDIEKSSSNDNMAVKLEREWLDIEGAENGIFYIPVIKDYIDIVDTVNKRVVLKRIPEYI